MDRSKAFAQVGEYLNLGWALILLPHGSKKPNTRGWQDKHVTLAEVEAALEKGSVNFGVMTGEPSRNLVRIDLDCEEARRCADHFLPPTQAVMGRGFQSNSGYLYEVTDGLGSSLTYKDPTGTGDEATLTDVLWTGKMTVLPPSLHPEGDSYEWRSFGPPAKIAAKELTDRVNLHNAGALLGRHWPDGGRHDATMALAGALAGEGMAQPEAEHFVVGTCLAAGDDEIEDRLRCVQDTYDRAEQEKPTVGWTRLQDMIDPRVIRRIKTWLGFSGATQADKVQVAEELQTTDSGNAKRMAKLFQHELRYNNLSHKWHVWDGIRWKQDDRARVWARAMEVSKHILLEAAAADSKDKREALASWAVESQSYSKIMAMIKLAQGQPTLAIVPDELDQGDWILNTPTGTLDLRNIKLADHDPNDLLSMVTRGRYDPSAKCPRWDTFIRQVFNNDDEVIRYMQRLAGYTLLGTCREQMVPICWGDGQNGKSSYLRSLVWALGDYGAWSPFDTFDASAKHGTGNDLARLKGIRMVIAIESDNERALAEGRIKMVTGGDRVACRFLYGEYFEYDPQFTIYLASNYKPVVRGTDHGIWRRISFIPFTQQFKGINDDKELREALEAEADGILMWMVEGLRMYLAEGLNPPESVMQATTEYKSEMDVMSHYLEECCIREDDAEVTSRELYARYHYWAKDYGEQQISHRSFSLELGRRGFRKLKANSSIRWRGLKLRPEVFRTVGMNESSPN